MLLGEYTQAIAAGDFPSPPVRPYEFEGLDNEDCNRLKLYEYLKKRINQKHYEWTTGNHLIEFLDSLLGGGECRETIDAHNSLIRE